MKVTFVKLITLYIKNVIRVYHMSEYFFHSLLLGHVYFAPFTFVGILQISVIVRSWRMPYSDQRMEENVLV